MKNIGASVSEVLTQEKKVEEEEGEIEEEEYIPMMNEMIFFWMRRLNIKYPL